MLNNCNFETDKNSAELAYGEKDGNIAVSIIIPVYNAEKYLEECLDSIIRQTLQNIEIICIDDDSTDDSVKLIQTYNDERIILLKQENSGSGIARNNGIRHAKGEYVVFMDPDDYYPDEFVLERLYYTAKAKKVLVCGGNIVNLDQQNKMTKGYNCFEKNKYINFYDFQDCWFHARYIINRKMLLENNIFYPNYRRYQDPPFLLRVMLCAKQFYAIHNDVYVYRIGNGSNKYEASKVRDMMFGLADVLRESSEHNLKELHEKCWEHVYQVYGQYIYYYIFKQESENIEAARKIDAVINLEILDKTKEQAQLLDSINYGYFQHLYKKQQEFDKRIHSNVPMIIYGAGCVGKKILSYIQRNGSQVLGIAVTQKNDKEKNSRIKEIKEYLEYKESALVIVATSELYQREITENLKKLQFKNIYCMSDIYFDFDKSL